MNTESLNIFLVFFEGVISFFSPCVLPLIPMYLGYLSGKGRGSDGEYSQARILLHTLFFILGIATTFFVAAYLSTSLATVLTQHSITIGYIGGAYLILMGIIQLGIFKGISFKREFRLPVHITQMNFLSAYIMGFTFSFAWTPCIGPMLSSVIVLAASSPTMSTVYITVYALGFMIPFLLMGLFSSLVLNALRKYRGIVQYTVKIGAVILIVLGGFLIKESYTAQQAAKEEEYYASSYDFKLVDQYGIEHTLSQYTGKEIVLSFVASWCPYCNMELTELEALYQSWNQNEEAVVIGVVAPDLGREISKEELLVFLEEMGVTFPILFDETGAVFNKYGVSSLPTTFVLDKNNEFYGYQSGMMSKDILEQVIENVRATYTE
ncbi:MAG: redoxin domain-containing protein [Erysipelotrichales bacterium]|nr:redoxin domain-containing protein [Erysipelotrichales bacterium]MBR3693635.1 redoxin domain-containing protein [Erysipelotrichales bacterium]